MYRLPSKWRRLVLDARWDQVCVPIYEASAGGRRVPLLKTLLTNVCVNECKYCALRRGMPGERCSWRIDRLVEITLRLWRQGVIEGLFLSSGMAGDPEAVTELEIEVAERLRERGFTGYIHLRLMPGTPRWLVWRAAEVADRIGVNLEAPTRDTFDEIAPGKADYVNDLLWVLEECARAWRGLRGRRGPGNLSAGVDTQVIVGASSDTDDEHLRLADRLYRGLGLRRVYFSGFRPVPGTPLEAQPTCPPRRVLRLYQASFLIRDYGFTYEELREIMDDSGMLPDEDPKVAFAKLHPELYPVDPEEAPYAELIRVPGIGPKAAREIIRLREERRLRPEDLVRILGRRRFRLAARYLALPRAGSCLMG